MARKAAILESEEQPFPNLRSSHSRYRENTVCTGIFSGEAVKRLNEAPIVECLVTDAIPVEEGGKIKTISVAQEFAEAIAAVYHEEPVSKLIGGDFAL